MSASEDTFRSYLARDWSQWVTEYPELGTQFGVTGLNDRWTDDSASGIEARTRHLHESRAALARIDPGPLSSSDRTSYDLYRELLDVAEAGLSFGLDPLPFRLGVPHNFFLPINQMEGVHLSAVETIEIQPRERVSDYEDILARIRSLPAAIDQNLALLKQGLSGGYSACRTAIRGVPDQVKGILTPEAKDSPLLRAFLNFPSRIGDADRARLTNEALRAYSEFAVPSLQRLHEYLTSTYLPACREGAGVSNQPNGASLYSYLVRWQTTTDLTPQQIHEIGMREVRRLRVAMEELMRKTGFQGSFEEFLDFLRTDDRFFYTDAGLLVDAYRVIAKKTDPGLARVFGRLPRLPYGVMPVPGFREASSPTAYYMPGAPAAGRPGVFYANTYKLHARPRWEMEALSLHESVPGHHLQLALAQELDDLPDFRRFTGPTAYVEGWGLYAESLGDDLGAYQDIYSRMGQYTYDMWRSARLVVDTGMHALGWTRDQAIRFLEENTGKSAVDIAVEVDRYIVWPGQALAYKMGQLKIRELRTWAERELGDRFDLRAFHDRVLEEGAIPLGLLESRVRAWASDRRSAALPPASAAGTASF